MAFTSLPVVTTAAAADGVSVKLSIKSPLAAITDGMQVAEITVDRAYYAIYWHVNCATDPEFYFGGTISASRGAGTYSIKAATPSALPVELNSGRTYTFRFETCEFGWDAPVQVASFEVTGGGAAAQQYADVAITAFDGTKGTLGYQFQNRFSVTFSAPVRDVKAFAPLGMDGEQSFTTKRLSTDGTQWSIDVSPMKGTEGAFELHIQATDVATSLPAMGSYHLDHSFIYTIYVGQSVSEDDPTEPELPSEDPYDPSNNPGGSEPDAPAAFALRLGSNELPSSAGTLTAAFTATEDCKVELACGQAHHVEYQGQVIAHTYIATRTPTSYIYEIDNVKAGTSVMLRADFVMTPTVVVTTHVKGQTIPLEYINALPLEGTSGFWDHNGQLTLFFNRQVSLRGAVLTAGGEQYSLPIMQVTSAVSLNVADVLNPLLIAGTVRPESMFSVTLIGLCDASDPTSLYGDDGSLRLQFVAPQPQYSLRSATVDGQQLSTSGLNSYNFLSYYAPETSDGLFVFEFEADVQTVDCALLQMGNRDLDAQGKYYEATLPVSWQGNTVIVDARGVLRSLSVIFPAVVDDEIDFPTAEDAQGLGQYDREHITLRLSSVKDVNGNYFRSQQVGNEGSYSYYMNYKEMMENINFDGDNKQLGDDVVPGEPISLWLSNPDVLYQGIIITYLVLQDDHITYEPIQVIITDVRVQPDAYQGVILSFEMPPMPNVAVGQTVRVALHNAISPDGMPHDFSIDFHAGNAQSGIEWLTPEASAPTAYSLSGLRLQQLPARVPVIVNGHRVIVSR